MAPRKKQPLTSTRSAAPGRRRLVLSVCLIGLLGCLMAGVAFARRGLDEAPGYHLVALEVHGLRLLTGEEVLAASGLQPGDSIFSADLDDVAARISQLVWVKEARVERRPPDRLVVTLQERRRTAWLEWHRDLYGLDEEGVILPRGRLTTEGVADLDLPVIRSQDDLTMEALVESGEDEPWAPTVGDTLPLAHEVRALLDWWQQVREQAPELVPEVSEILPLDGESVRLRLVADDLEIRMPLNDTDCMSALLGVLERVYHDVPDAAYVDLRFRGQAVVGTQPSVVPARMQRPTPEDEAVSHG